MSVPIVAIEVLFGINEVDTVIHRLAGNLTPDSEDEAIRVVALMLRRLAADAPEGWDRFAELVRQAGVRLEADRRDLDVD